MTSATSSSTTTEQPKALATETPETEAFPTNVFLGLFIDPEGNVIRHSYVLADDKEDALSRMGTWPEYITEAVQVGTTTEPPLPLGEAPRQAYESMAARNAARAAKKAAEEAEAEAKKAEAEAKKEEAAASKGRAR